jgi:predicted DNA-binding antitoxin AbrB/MazE fold protein
MTITAKAVYQNGQLQLTKPVQLPDGTAVHVTITPVDEDYDPLDAVIGIGESGRKDGADNHDHYLYGTQKRR